VPQLPAIFDEPFADSSQIPTFLVSRFARSKVTVCLSGDGGDELFAGYNRYMSTERIWKRLSQVPYPARSLAGKLLGVPPPRLWDSIYARLVGGRKSDMEKQKLVGLKLQKLAGLMQQRDQMQGYNYLLSYWNRPDELVHLKSSNAEPCRQPGFPPTESFINRAMYLDQIGYLQGDNLTKVDRASMAVSLETRLPLLSHEVVELAWRIPVEMKARPNASKWALRQVLFKYVPRNLIERPKMGFSVPVADWLRKELREWAADMLGLMENRGAALLDEKRVFNAWNQHLAGTADHSQRIWTVLMLLSWMEKRNIR
jgi:asparagine synthase (glutamine-hydrolysing)